MSASIKNVAVVGAGGNLGPHIVNALVSGGFNVTIIARAESKSTFPADIKVTKGDYTPEFLQSAFEGQDAVVITVASSSLDQQKLLIDAAVKAGVKRIIPSEFGSDTLNPKAVAAVPFYQAKLDIHNYLKAAVAESPKTTFTSVVTGPFFDWCLQYLGMGFDFKNHTGTLFDGGVNKFDTATLPSVGKGVAKILSQPDKYQNETVYLSSFTVSQLDILAALKKATGVEDWKLEEKSAQQDYEEGKALIAKGDYAAGTLKLIFASTLGGTMGADYSTIRKISNEELGLEKEDLVEVVKDVLKKL